MTTFHYTATRLRFRQQAPQIADYCAHCKLVFDVLLEELELKNAGREGCESRTFSPDYDALRSVLRIGKKRYYETLEWLDSHQFIQYIRGNRYTDGYIQLLHLAEITPSNLEVLPRTQTEPRQNPDETQTEPRGQNSSFCPPPYPPIEELNIITPTYLTNGQAGEAGVSVFSKPKNIVLSEEEESDLLTTYGPEFTARMLLLVAAYKRDQGGTLKASDFENCIRWAANRVKENDLKLGLSVTTSRPNPIVAQHTTTRRVFKEWT